VREREDCERGGAAKEQRCEMRLTRSRDSEHDDCEESLDTSNDEVHHVGSPGWCHCDCDFEGLVCCVGGRFTL